MPTKGFAAVVLLAAAAILSAQQAPSPAPQEARQTVIKVGVDLVRVDATVTDRDGRHVTDLTPADFEILQDGKPQSISTFAYVAAGTRRPECQRRGAVVPAGHGR